MFPFTVYLLHNTILNNVNIALDFYLFLIFQPANKQKDTKFLGFVSF